MDSLPGDPIQENYLRQVHGACYSHVQPARAGAPALIAYSKPLATELGFSEVDCGSAQFEEIFAGNALLEGMKPFAMCYGGHQFGNWAGQLGDGRAITLGEIRDTQKRRQFLQLKGAGQTPYSRSADGLAVLRSSLREFVCSEAMHHLGVPTTRALTLVASGDAVVRDMLYDGNPMPEPGAVVCRVAPSFVRFGNFEICVAQRNVDLLRQLADYTIRSDFPHITTVDVPKRYVVWFEDILNRTIDMIVHWMRVGFVHGVMNTDNMSILGLTIDYGPYGWLEDYDPDWTPNTTDEATRRYRFGNQPWIAQWNLLQLANAIVPLVGDTKPLEEILNDFPQKYQSSWEKVVRQKLGLVDAGQEDQVLVTELEKILKLVETDMTLFFRNLASLNLTEITESADPMSEIETAYYELSSISTRQRERINRWLQDYASMVKRQNQDAEQRVASMNATNPLYVPRNYLAQLAIDEAEKGNYSYLQDWMQVLENPYQAQEGKESFAEKRPDWAKTRVGCSMLSCSS